ncbi:MAG TPA: PAS domain-containing sensor histidine kinase [Dehalococcoidia bacterium]|nr:PAS domain-containing sensor histidine kinase [Dehalococcoidia bacterium]
MAEETRVPLSERFRAALEQSPVILFSYDRSLRYTRVFNAPLELVCNEFVGKTDFDVLATEDAARTTAIMRSVLTTGRRVRTETWATIAGERRYFDVIADPLIEPSGEVVGVTGVLIDVSERKAQERQWHQFLSAISHDLKSPLAAIRGVAQKARRLALSLPDASRERLVADLEMILSQVTRTVAMINDLVALQRAVLGVTPELDRQPVDLTALTQRTVAECQPATDKHVPTVHAPSGPLVGTWDRARLERVLNNLISNAFKYSPEDGDIEVTVGQEDGWAVIRVSDHGIGIPSDEISRVTDHFYRGSNAVGKFEGLGIGLSSALEIVRQHGGDLSIESELGRGSTFIVRLPLA